MTASKWKSPQADRWSTAVLCAVAAFALGQAVQVANGAIAPVALGWLTLACLAGLAGVAAPTHEWLERRGERIVVLVLGLGAAVQFGQLASTWASRRLFWVFEFWAFAVAAILVGSGLSKSPLLGRAQFPLLLLIFLCLGGGLIFTSPAPFIDVDVFQRDGIAALLHGNNPYALRYPDIYALRWGGIYGNASPFYGEGLSVNGQLQFGYPYMPLSLLLALPAQVLLGDYRYAQLAAMAGAAAFIAYARPCRVGVGAASLLLFTPRAFYVLQQGWTDPFVLLALAAVVFFALRWARPMPWILGLALAMKQYTIFMALAAWQILPRPLQVRALGQYLLKAAAAGTAVTLPFLLWGPGDFWHDVVALQFLQPFRHDALSYLAWSAQRGEPWPTWLGFAAALVGVALGLWRQARTPAGFAATCALTYLGFFAFNKQAFCNYYYFTLGALLVVVGAIAPLASPNIDSGHQPASLLPGNGPAGDALHKREKSWWG